MMDPSSSNMGMHSSTNPTSGGGNAGNGHGSGSNAAGGSQSSSTPQSRARVTVVCAECKRLKLKCDRRAPCGSCVKRDTVARCQYSAAAAEKVDIHSVNNRLLNVESHLNIVSNGQFQSSYPPANLTGGAATSSTSIAGATSTASNVPSYVPSWPSQSQSQSHQQAQHLAQHTMLPHPLQMHTQPYPSPLPPQPSQAQHFAARLPRTLNPLHDALNISDEVLESVWVGPLEGVLEGQQGHHQQRQQGTGGEMRVKQEEFDFSTSLPSASASASGPLETSSGSTSGSSSASTITPGLNASSSSKAKQKRVSLSSASRHLPAFSIYIPPPEIGVPGSSTESGGAFPFGGASTSNASSSGGGGAGEASNKTQTQAKAQVTPGLLRLLPSLERCEAYLKAAGDVVGVRGVLLDSSSSSSTREKDIDLTKKAEKKSNDGMKKFRARALRLISSSSSSVPASATRRTHARPISRTSSISSTSSSSSSSSSGSDSEDAGAGVGGHNAHDAEPQAETQQEKEAREARERKERAREIYFKGVANPPPMLAGATRGPVRRKVREGKERESKEGKERPAKHTDGKDREGLTFFAMVCAALAIGAHRVELSSSTSTTSPNPSPLFLYALSQQALGVWDTSSSDGRNDHDREKEKERTEYIQACLLGLQVLIDDKQDGDMREDVSNLIAKLTTSARALEIDQEISFVGRRARLEVELDVNAKRRDKEEKKEEMKRCLWWECVWWDMITSDTYAFQPFISLNAYSTQLPLCASRGTLRYASTQRSGRVHIEADQDLNLIEMTDDALDEYDEVMESGGDDVEADAERGLFDEFVAVPRERAERGKGKETDKKQTRTQTGASEKEMSEIEEYRGARYRLTQLIHSIKKRTSDASSSFVYAPSPMSMGSFAGDAYAPSAAGVNIMPPPISGASALYCSSYTLDQASALEEALRSWMDSLPISLQVPLADADDADVNIDPALSATSISKDQSIMKMHACELSILANLGIFHIWVPFLRQQSKPSMASHSCVAAGQGLVASLKSYSSMSSLPSTSSFNKDLPLPAMLALVSPLKMISDSVVVLAHSAFVGRNSRRVRERKMVMQDLKDALEVYDSLGGKSLSGRKATVIDAVRKRLEGARPAMRSAAGSMQNQQNQPQVQQVGTKRKHAEVDYSANTSGAAANFHIAHPHPHPGGVGSGVSGTTEGHGAAAVSNADGISSGSASLSAPTTTTTTGYDYSTVDAGYYDPSGNVDYTSHANAEQMQYEVQQQEQQHHEHQQQQYLQNAIGVAQQQPQNFDHVEGGLVRLNMMGDVEVHHPQPRVESHGLHELQHGQPQSLSSHRTPTPTLVAASRPHSAHPHQHQHPHAHRPYDPRDRPNRHAPEQHTRVQHHPHQHGTSHHRDKEGGKKSSGNSSSGSGSSTGSYPSKGIRKRDGRAVPRKDGVLHLNTPNVGGDVGGREGMTSQAILAMRAQKDAAASALGLGGSLVPSGLTAPSPHPIAVSMPMQLSNPIPIHTADAPMSNPTTSSAMGNHNVLSMSMPLVDSPLSMDQAQSHPDLMNASVYSRSRSSSLSHVQHMSTHQIHTQTPRIEYTTVSSAPAPPVFGSGAAGSDTPLQPPRKRQTLEVPVLHHPRGQHHMSPQPPQFGSQYTSPGGFDTSVSSSVDGSSNNNAYGTGTGTSPFSTGNNSPYASGHPIPLSAATPTFNVMPHQTQAQHLSQQSQQHVQQHNQHTQLPHQPTPPTFGPGPSTPSTSHSSSSTSGLPGQQVRSGSGSQSQNQSASQSPVNYFNSPGIPYGSTNSSLDDTLSLPHQHSMISMSMPSTPVYEKHGGFDTFQHRQMGYQNSHHELGLGQAMDMDVSGTGYGGVGVEHDGQHQQQMVDWSSNPGTPVSTGGVDGGGTGTRETFWQSGYY